MWHEFYFDQIKRINIFHSSPTFGFGPVAEKIMLQIPLKLCLRERSITKVLSTVLHGMVVVIS